MTEWLSPFTLVIYGMLERPPSMSTWPDVEHRSFGSISWVPDCRPSRAVFMHGETNFMTETPDSIPRIPALYGHIPCLDIEIHTWNARFHTMLGGWDSTYGMPGSSFVNGESNNYFEIYISRVRNSGFCVFFFPPHFRPTYLFREPDSTSTDQLLWM